MAELVVGDWKVRFGGGVMECLNVVTGSEVEVGVRLVQFEEGEGGG